MAVRDKCNKFTRLLEYGRKSFIVQALATMLQNIILCIFKLPKIKLECNLQVRRVQNPTYREVLHLGRAALKYTAKI